MFHTRSPIGEVEVTGAAHATHGHPRLAWRALVALAVLLAGFLALPATTASAYSTQTAGRPGSVTPYAVVGQLVSKSTNGYYSTLPGVRVPGPYVGRSPASTGAQAVIMNMVVEQWWPSTGSWVTKLADNVWSNTLYLQSGQSGQFNDRYEQLGTGTYRVTYVLRWYDSYGSLLAMKTINFNHYDDYQCRTAYGFTCQTGTGWVRVA